MMLVSFFSLNTILAEEAGKFFEPGFDRQRGKELVELFYALETEENQ